MKTFVLFAIILFIISFLFDFISTYPVSIVAELSIGERTIFELLLSWIIYRLIKEFVWEKFNSINSKDIKFAIHKREAKEI
jgi:hypothetical protein